MGRLPLVDPDDGSAPESVRAVLRTMREATGRDFNVIRATANHPAIFEVIDDELYAELEHHYPAEQIIELCFTVGLSNIVNRFHATFHTDLDVQTADVFRDGSPLPLPRWEDRR